MLPQLNAMSWFELPTRRQKIAIVFGLDLLFLSLAFWGALWVRFESVHYFYDVPTWVTFVSVIVTTLAGFWYFGLYRAVLRYINEKNLQAILFSFAIATLLMIVTSFYLQAVIPRTAPFIYLAFGVIFCGGTRFAIRFLFVWLENATKQNVIIFGAGDSGRQLLQAIGQGDDFQAVAFIDDKEELRNSLIHGLTVYQPKQLPMLIRRFHATKVLLAIPNAGTKRRAEVLTALADLNTEVLTVPRLNDLVTGDAKVDQIKEVDVEDLLGRESVTPNAHLMESSIRNKTVLVSGAGGSIGSELCRQILQFRPARLLLVERSEVALYQIERELKEMREALALNIDLVPLMISVQHLPRLSAMMEASNVDTVYHAAAYKHVPLVEQNVVEGVCNNVFGSYNIALAAIKAKVKTFVLVSTDKAVRPTNVMGATKRLAELVMQSLAEQQSDTTISMVRFGNVLGSSGSVIPLFKDQIRKGEALTITHPDIIRYFMTIPEAAQLVIQAGSMANGGEVFVLDMGEPVKIAELAKRMVHLSGLEVRDDENPDGDIELQYTGLRPGEKLYEELLVGDDERPTDHPRILTANESFMPWDELMALFDELNDACEAMDKDAVIALLKQAPLAYCQEQVKPQLKAVS
ncbi:MULTISPECIES: nucleoside-diphosphate sugar epimerase/dehydratase [unclassified Agarivorans]|uniref:nucleoside-diphosphate sugar epimerase/dehydratase n=1 Tax=unclassified Agarivorans TaxID=2636026 RepID=UPI0026E30171|nr:MULTISPECIES: nucleoside-diphosphate sugar epimerase/dehydratase [unclassified Agarivorans]MDO6686289.1 nucleoside-diphosphate sugar epimerase/dehydratase [Agarivorans sp. 3_MG-2023]MDO6716262.1 nucleoside-diphosphate sugar epimerase/dehydratase [Agarivorans sp. 2_MG-2023]